MALGDPRCRLHDQPLLRYQHRQVSIEDGFDLVAEAVVGRTHTIGADLHVRREPDDQVVRVGAATHQGVDVEAVRVPAGTQVVGEVVHHAAVGHQALRVARELQLAADL